MRNNIPSWRQIARSSLEAAQNTLTSPDMRVLLALLCLALPAAAQDAVGRVNTGGFNVAQMCSGTLVQPNVVLTAAHCTSRKDGTVRSIKDMIFVAGWTGEGHAGAARVAGIKVHPKAYATGTLDFRYDIAVLHLEEPLPLPPMAVGLAAKGPYAIAGYMRRQPHRLHVDDDCAGWPERGVLLLDCAVEQGLSGGPVFAGEGDARRIVAVVVARMPGGAVAVPINNWLRATLSRPYTP